MSERAVGPLVSTDWLAEHLRAPGLVVVEIDEQPLIYNVGHIEGARNVDWRAELQDPVTRDVPTPAAMEALWQRLGIDRASTVVLYGDKNNWYAAFGYWLFRYMGMTHVALLDGGRQAWLTDGKPVTRALPVVRPASRPPSARVDETLRARWREVVGAHPQPVLIDVRTRAEYRGDVLTEPGYESEGAQRAGHIPGARSVPWDMASAPDGRFLPAGALSEIYASRGITPARPVITYCRIGERSAHTWFVLQELLGWADVRNYDGSWTEWGSMVGAPVALGDDPGEPPDPLSDWAA